jgi:hypothetical protein
VPLAGSARLAGAALNAQQTGLLPAKRRTPSPCKKRRYGFRPAPGCLGTRQEDANLQCPGLLSWMHRNARVMLSPLLCTHSQTPHLMQTSHDESSATLRKGYRIIVFAYPAVCLAVSCDYSQRDLHNCREHISKTIALLQQLVPTLLS